MKWLILLVASVVTASGAALMEGTKELAERIVKTEQECADLKTLKEHYRTPYTNLLAVCEESLNQDKYAYIDMNSVDLSEHPGGEFPVSTGHGQSLVKKPPQVSADEVQEKIKDIGDKEEALAKSASKRAQEIVDQQVKCALANSKEDEECTQSLNCKKDKFMADEKLNLKHHRHSFPITYKGRVTKINSPPDTVRACDGSSSRGPDETTTETAEENSRDSTAADEEKSDGDAATRTGNDDETDFAELEDLEKQAPRRKRKGTSKMVTKGLFDIFKKNNPNSAAGNIQNNLIPAIHGAGVTLALSSLNRNHVDSLMTVATNRLKRKQNRDKVNRDDLRAAIEIFTKTLMHFLIVTAEVSSNMRASNKATHKNPVTEQLKIALMNAAAAYLVNFLIDKLLPEDEFQPKNDVIVGPLSHNKAAQQSKQKGYLGGFFGGQRTK